MPEEIKSIKEEKPPEIATNLPFVSAEGYAPIQHIHGGTDTPKVSASNLRDNLNIFKTNTTNPITAPGNFWARIQPVTAGGSSRLYIYDTSTSSWKSVIIS